MKKLLAVVMVLMVSCFASAVFAAHEVGNVDQQPIVGGMVDIYGVAKLSVDSITTDAKGAGAESNLTKVSSNSSRIGFTGAENVGNLWAIYQLELGYNVDDAGGNVTLRNSYVGLTSKSFGKLIFGNHDTPYKSATGKLDAFGDTMGEYNAIIGNVNGTTNFELRNDNVIQYQTPTWGGLHFVAAVSTTGTETDPSPAASASSKSAHVAYSSGPLYATVAYEIQKNGFTSWADATTMTGTRLGVGYNLKATGTNLGVVFEMLDNDLPNSVFTRDAVYVSVKQKFGTETLKLAYGSADDGDNPATKTGATFMAVGVDHPLSKRTTAYVLYATTDNDADATYGLGQGGAGGAYRPAAGDSPSVISFGINHSF